MKKKVLIILPEGWGNGGVQHVLMSIVRNLNEEYEFTALKRTSEKRYFDEEFELLGGINIEVNSRKNEKSFKGIVGKALRVFKRFKTYYYCFKAIEKNKYDIIHINCPEGIFALIARLRKIKNVIFHVHTDVNLNFFNKCLIDRFVNQKVTASISSMQSAYFKKRIESNEIKTIYNPIDLDKFDSSKFLKNDSKTCRLIQIASYNENKNQTFLLKLAKIMQDENYDFKLVLCGWGKYKEILLNMINEMDLKDRVIMIDGTYANIPFELSKSDVLLLPSKSEAFGLVLVEAQAMNVPFIASDVCSKEANVGLGHYISLNNSDMWIEKIYELKKNENSIIKKSEFDKFSIVRYVQNIELLYEYM